MYYSKTNVISTKYLVNITMITSKCPLKIRHFVSAFQIQLYLCTLNGLNYQYFDKHGNKSSSFLSKLTYGVSLTVFFISFCITILKCPDFKLELVTVFIRYIQFYGYMISTFSHMLWFGVYNNNVIAYFKKLLIVDQYMLNNLSEEVNYKRRKRVNLLRLFVAYCYIILFIFCQVMSALSNLDYKAFNNLYCPAYWSMNFYMYMNINCLSNTFTWELTTRMDILYSCSKNNKTRLEYFHYFNIIYSLLFRLSKDINSMFSLYYLHKLFLFFTGYLHYFAHAVGESADYYWNFLILMTLLDLAYDVYSLEYCKLKVSFLNFYNINIKIR